MNSLKIALCGAHGTGKTTLANCISKEKSIPVFGSLRSRWRDFGISDFDLLPKEVRTVFQVKMINSQIEMENKVWDTGFITDRSVVDYLAYSVISSDMSGDLLQLFTNLVYERLRAYDHVFYTPIEFDAEPETLRASIEIREEIDAQIISHLTKCFGNNGFTTLTGSVDDRLSIINQSISNH